MAQQNLKINDIASILLSKVDQLTKLLQQKSETLQKLEEYNAKQSASNQQMINAIDKRIEKLSSHTVNVDTSVLDEKLSTMTIIPTKLETVFVKIGNENIKKLNQAFAENTSYTKKQTRIGDKYFQFFVWVIGILAFFLMLSIIYIFGYNNSKRQLQNENDKLKIYNTSYYNYLSDKNLLDKYYKWTKEH